MADTIETRIARQREHVASLKRLREERNKEAAARITDALVRLGELEAQAAEVERLRAYVNQWHEREAAVCPEDVGFEEVIAGLRVRVAEYDKDAGRWRALRDSGGYLSSPLGALRLSGNRVRQPGETGPLVFDYDELVDAALANKEAGHA
jgi:hypothetical protein